MMRRGEPTRRANRVLTHRNKKHIKSANEEHERVAQESELTKA
jgi:hypothetical protein